MKSLKLVPLSCFMLLAILIQGQSIEGIWVNIDDEDGKPKSHIEITKSNGQYYGKVVRLLEGATLKSCTKCKGERQNKPIEGMVIMWDLSPKNSEEADGGSIIDPKNGKTYGCKIKLSEPDVLEVRGYIKSPLFGRTQKWYRKDN